MANINQILIEYAQEKGGGLPLSAKEICNAIVLWAQKYFANTSGSETINAREEDGKLIFSVNTQWFYNWLVEEINAGDGITQEGLDFSIDQEWLKDFIRTNFFNAIDLSELFDGSETIVVDVSEDNSKIEIHLDAEFTQRAVLTPLSNPSEPKLPVLGVDGAIAWEPVNSFGGGSKLYLHYFGNLNGEYLPQVTFISRSNEPVALPNLFNNQSKYALERSTLMYRGAAPSNYGLWYSVYALSAEHQKMYYLYEKTDGTIVKYPVPLDNMGETSSVFMEL